MSSSRFDELLHTIIVEKGQGIYGFFDEIFGFMYRRTDLFYEMAPGENMGFFPGQGEAIVYNYFRKYQAMHYKERVPKRNIDPKEIDAFMKEQKEKKEKVSNPKATESSVEPIEVKKEEKKVEKEKEEGVEKKDVVAESIPKQANPKVEKISSYNGDQCENYTWSQSVYDVSIQMKLPPNTHGKMVLYLNRSKCK